MVVFVKINMVFVKEIAKVHNNYYIFMNKGSIQILEDPATGLVLEVVLDIH